MLHRQQPVGVGAAHLEGGRLQPGLLAERLVVDLGVEAPGLGPAQVHALQHLRPVHGVDAALTGVDGDDRVGAVVLTRQQRGHLELVDGGTHLLEALGDLRGGALLVLLLRELVEDVEVVEPVVELVVATQIRLDPRQLGRDLARVLGVVPEVGGRRLLLELGQPRPFRIDVKDSSGRAPRGAAARRGRRRGSRACGGAPRRRLGRCYRPAGGAHPRGTSHGDRIRLEGDERAPTPPWAPAHRVPPAVARSTDAWCSTGCVVARRGVGRSRLTTTTGRPAHETGTQGGRRQPEGPQPRHADRGGRKAERRGPTDPRHIAQSDHVLPSVIRRRVVTHHGPEEAP